ncbi:MAG: hypothetical protein GY849_08185, partial [Deltaproteobacteria bacterium]|nr:hypothetical protein [Deltaproteobacteria bacterium]
NAVDGVEVSHFKISGITNGTLYLADGATEISNDSFITYAEGVAGLKFTPSADSNSAGSFDVEASEDGSVVAEQSEKATSTITVTPVGDTPTVDNITTNEDTQSDLIYIARNAVDGVEVSHFRISGITNGTLYLADGATEISDDSFITYAEGVAGLKFTPSADSNSAG